MTNGDRIRGATDEALAVFLTSVAQGIADKCEERMKDSFINPNVRIPFHLSETYEEEALEWLRQEVTHD